METTGIPYALFVDLSLAPPRLSSIWQMTKFVFQRKLAARHLVLMIWLISTLVWVMGRQVFTDAMTSYASDGVAYVQIIEQSFITFQDMVQSDLVFQPMQAGQYCDYVPLLVSSISIPIQPGAIFP